MVVVATLVAQRLFFDESSTDAVRSVGLVKPKLSGVFLAFLVSLGLLLTLALYAKATATSLDLLPNWPWLAVGMFFQAGIAEETLFRGYLYGYFRRRHMFWRAAALSAVPFVAVHLLIFFTLHWTIAAASIGLCCRDVIPTCTPL